MDVGDLSTKEAAAFAHVHPRTLKEWVRSGKVRAQVTPGGHYRFRRADLEAAFKNADASNEVQAS